MKDKLVSQFIKALNENQNNCSNAKKERSNLEFFRFDEYEDVFVEDDHFLYVQREAFGWVHLFACCEYKPLYHLDGCFDEWLVSDWSGASYEYLRTLERAPLDITLQILEIETRKTAKYNPDIFLADFDSYIAELNEEHAANGYPPLNDEEIEARKAEYLEDEKEHYIDCKLEDYACIVEELEAGNAR